MISGGKKIMKNQGFMILQPTKIILVKNAALSTHFLNFTRHGLV
jgi:hypothetical protein